MAITLDGSDNKIAIGANATGSSAVRLYEDTDNGTNYVDIIAPASITSNRTLTLPDATGTLLTNSGTEAGAFSTLSINSNNISAENSLGFRNRIINGDMRIDQRNAGASVTPTGNAYTIDRWTAGMSQSSKFSVQRSTTAPTGFINSALITSTSAYSVTSTDRFAFSQFIEGLNCTDLGWGTASAKTITLSFQVRSSLTGTFGGALQNNAADRAYPFTYTISAANTWETKTVTVAGDTTGTWLTDTGIGIQVRFSLGTGSTYSNTAGAWVAGDYRSATGATSVVGTNGATLYITGVQLEVGSVATPFERRDYGRELIMCQRYFYRYENTTGGATPLTVWQVYATTSAFGSIFTFPVVMRATPTATTSGTFLCYNAAGSSALNFTAFNVDKMTPYTAGSNGSNVASGLVVGDATVVYAPNNGSISLTAEL